MFATDKDAELNGVWIDLAEDASFRVKRFGGRNANRIKQLQLRYLRPYAKQIEKGILDPDKERGLYVLIFVESCMVDWKGVLDENDKEIEYSKENAMNLFKTLPDLFDFLVSESLSDDSYKEDLGNS
jgi:hypothetical protein